MGRLNWDCFDQRAGQKPEALYTRRAASTTQLYATRYQVARSADVVTPQVLNS